MTTLGSRALVTVLTLVACAAPARGAGAQTVNYGVLQDIFGEPVTTSATGTPKLQSDVPVSMEIITADEIRRSGAGSIPDVLRQVTGLDVWTTTTLTSEVAVRGFNQYQSPRLLVLINGRQVYIDGYGVTLWNSLPVELAEIRQIEVVKGPNAALFGFNAVGGVVNIITFNPLYDDVNTATVRVGTQEHRQVSAVATVKPTGSVGVRLSAGGFGGREFDTPYAAPSIEARASDYRRDPYRRSFSADSLVQLADHIQLGLEATHTRMHGSTFAFSGEYGKSDAETSSAKSVLTAQTKFGLVEATAYRNWVDFGFITPDQNLVFGLDTARNTNVLTVLRVQDTLRPSADHTLRFAAEHRNTRFSGDMVSATIERTVTSGSVTWDWQLTDSLTLTNAVRLDWHSFERDGSEQSSWPQVPQPFTNADFEGGEVDVGFNSGVVYKIGDLDTLRLSVGRGLQLPSMLEAGAFLRGRWPNGPMLQLAGNPDLDSTVVTNYEIGWDRKIPALAAGLRSAVYYQTNEHLRYQRIVGVLPTTPPTYFQQFENVASSRAIGAELSLRGRVGERWRWGLGYAYEHIDDDILSGSTLSRGFPRPANATTPQHRVNGSIGYMDGRFEADLFANVTSSYKATYSVEDLNFATPLMLRTVPTQLTLSGRVAYNVTDAVTVAIEGQSVNLADHYESGASAVERRLFLSVTSRF